MPPFHFKHFSVSHDFGMKIGTDAVLLGAWLPIDHSARILDVGTGTGIIALMLAQRNAPEIVGIDIDKESVAEAQHNVLQSPWKDKIRIQLGDFCDKSLINTLEKFDLLVSNPPYFIHSMKSPFENRNMARHSESLPFETMIQNAKFILKPEGKLSIILPVPESKLFTKLAENHQFYPEIICDVLPYPNASANRKMILFQQKKSNPTFETLCIRNTNRSYSAEYKSLTRDFYLNLDKQLMMK